jgi:hypothetical protein
VSGVANSGRSNRTFSSTRKGATKGDRSDVAGGVTVPKSWHSRMSGQLSMKRPILDSGLQQGTPRPNTTSGERDSSADKRGQPEHEELPCDRRSSS